MTNEEAIKILKDTAFLAYQNASLDEINEAVGMAIQALELKIPKKPLRQGRRYFCPTCGKRFENLRPAHCFNGDCHQAINWENDNDE